MVTRFSRTVSVLLAALLGVVVGSVGPGVARAAYDAVNADKVDGFHAVGSGASANTRAGKLVAANPEGRAPDAERLNGFPHGKLRHISLPIQGVAVESGASKGSAVVVLPNTGTPAFNVSFIVPPDYKPGSPVLVDMFFEDSSGACTLYLFTDGLAGRPGGFVTNSGWRAPGNNNYFGPVAVAAGAARARTVAFKYQTDVVPGQLLSFHLTRASENAADTCGQTAVYGLQVRY